jgi:hypothetical protein
MSAYTSEKPPRFLPLVVLAFTTGNVAQSLFINAWMDDLYLRGAACAFAIWFIPVIYRIVRRTGYGTGFVWMILAIVLGTAGGMSELKVLSNLSFACACIAATRPRRGQLVWPLFAMTWLPFTGWLLKHFVVGGLAGWERPLIALPGTILFFVAEKRYLESIRKELSTPADHD